jgi:hypothetical protein
VGNIERVAGEPGSRLDGGRPREPTCRRAIGDSDSSTGRGWRLNRQPELGRRSLPQLALCPDPPTVGLDQGPGDVETEASAFGLLASDGTPDGDYIQSVPRMYSVVCLAFLFI